MSTPVMKRLMREAQQMAKSPVREYHAYPTEGNLLEWHFTLRGPDDSPYSEGLYHGRVLVPSNYPFAPPDVVLITPNGRFELEKKICLSISSYHPENWQSTWGIATVLTALRDFMLTPGNNGIGAVEYPSEVRAQLAKQSRSFKCPDCGARVLDHLEMMDAAPPAGDTAVPATPATPATAAKTDAKQQPLPQPSPLEAGKPAQPGPSPSQMGTSDAASSPQQPGAPSPLAAGAPVKPAGPPSLEGSSSSGSGNASPSPQAAQPEAPERADSTPAHPTPASGNTPAEAQPAPPAPAAAEPAAAAAPQPEQQQQAQEPEQAQQQQAPAAAAPAAAATNENNHVAFRRRGHGVEVQLSVQVVDAALLVLAVIAALLLAKKAVLDAPRPETYPGQVVRTVWGLVSRTLWPASDDDWLAEL